MDFPIKSFSPSRKVSPPCLPLLSLGTQQPPGDLYSGNIIITSTTLIVNINDHSLRISFSSQGLNSTDGANNRWQNGKRWEEETIFSKYYTFSYLQTIHFNIHIFWNDFIVSESWKAHSCSGLRSGAWSGRHRGNPTVIRTKNIKDSHHQVFLVLQLWTAKKYIWRKKILPALHLHHYPLLLGWTGLGFQTPR